MPFSPSAGDVSLATKLHEHVLLTRSYLRQRREGPRFDELFADLVEYDEILQAHKSMRLVNARMLEIGFGARPYRMLALLAMGIDVQGVDIEVPILEGRLREYIHAYEVNGFERMAKSIVRRALFDGAERRAFIRELEGRSLQVRFDRSRFRVADAAQLDIPLHSLDLIVSEDVFEHIPSDSLRVLAKKMRKWLQPGGLALIRPNVFPGITGGHLVEWSRASFERGRLKRRSEPWEHLRKKRFRPNTFLNELTRREYRELFRASGFNILEERVKRPELGAEYLTPDVEVKLERWGHDELLSNQVLFVFASGATR